MKKEYIRNIVISIVIIIIAILMFNNFSFVLAGISVMVIGINLLLIINDKDNLNK